MKLHQTRKACRLTGLMLKMCSGGLRASLGVKTVTHNNSKMLLIFFIGIFSQVYAGVLQGYMTCDVTAE